MKKIIISGSFMLFSGMIYSQNVTQEVSQSKQVEVSRLESTYEYKETIPTPEEQGFTKYELNGKIVYRKEVSGVIVEFNPEKK